MKKDDRLYELIYDYFESRILFGYYPYGTQLSSVSQISEVFQVGKNTVLAALAKLEEKGYIVTEERKVARITYEGTEEAYEKNAANYFAPRKDGILDFPCADKLLFRPMWKNGMGDLEPDSLNVPSLDVLRSFHNDLILNLYWQFLRYLSFLYPRKNENAFDFHDIQNKVLEFIETASAKYHLENVKQIPFTWTIYRRRPQVRYTLASIIIREILWGSYPVGSFLPSLPKLAQQYQVSVSTVRRTLAVLQSLGITRTYMGIGTKVSMEAVDFSPLNSSEIQENLRLHGQGLQILSLTVRGVVQYTLESQTQEKRDQLLQELTRLHGKTSSILYMDVLLNFISRECPSAIIRECYGKLRELIAWGYIVSATLMNAGQLDSDFTDTIRQLEKDLQAGNLTAFAQRWHLFIESRLNFFNAKFPFQEN